ncbi:MAG: flippase-like domain-containing protein [Lachnospiraceae bacterium]|nr:flippase-like domain-containing protein [Lachnospiraceae bacterium]
MKALKKNAGLILQLIIIVLIAVLTWHAMFHGRDARQIIRSLREAKKCWIAVGVLLMVFFVFAEAVQLKILFRGMGQKIGLFRCYLLSNVEFFFAQITPGAAGGQPIQMIYMGRFGVDVLVGALACMVIAVLYKAAFIVIFLVMLLFRPRLVWRTVSRVPFLFTFGVIFQLLSIFFLTLCIFRPVWASALLEKLIRLGEKLHIVKHPDRARAKARYSVEMYRNGSKFLKSHKWVVARMFLYTVAQRIAYFSVTFCVAKALGVRHADWFGIVAVQVILSLSVDALPLPGAAGANELVFLRIQSRFFPPNKLDAGLLLNRGLTYYFLLICCGAFTMCANFIRKKRHHGYLMEPGGEAPPVVGNPPEAEAPSSGEEAPEESGGEPESKES